MGRSVLKSAAMIFMLTVASKALGFLKSVLQAFYYGADAATDAFNIANNMVVGVVYMITASVAVAFVPIYIKEKSKGEKDRKEFAERTLAALIFLSVILMIVLEIVAPLVIRIGAPSYEGKPFSQTVYYYRILLLGVVFSLCTNIYVNILNAEKIYGFSALTSVVNSLVLIAFISWGHDPLGIMALVIAVPASYLVQFICLYIKGARFATVKPRRNIWDENIKLLCVQTLPILISYASVEVNQIVDGAILSGLETGAVTAVSYGAILNGFASACINTALSTVMFTEASEAVIDRDEKKIKGNLLNMYYGILIIGFPILIVTVLCAGNIVKIVYGRGAFDAAAVNQTGMALRIYGIGLMAGLIKNVTNRVYYAYLNMKSPMIYGIMEVILNISASIILAQVIGVAGVIIGTVLASVIFAAVLLLDFHRRYFKVVNRAFFFGLWKVIVSAILAFSIALYAYTKIHVNLYIDFGICVCLVFAVYIAVLFFLKDTMTIRIAGAAGASFKRRINTSGKG